MTILSKIKWVASILLIFFIVLVTNIIDRNNYNRLSYSVTTMYEDRIVASDLIFKMSRLIQDKQIAAVTNDTTFFITTNNALNQEIDDLINRYKQTDLTETEEFVFDRLQKEIKSLELKEESIHTVETSDLLKSIDKINKHFYDLSKIQLEEGNKQLFISGKAQDTINLFSQIEIIFLILMAIVVQIIILYKPKDINEE